MNIYIIGAGGFAAECHLYLTERMKSEQQLKFCGFLAEENHLNQYGLENFFLGHYENFSFKREDRIILAIGTPHIREKIYTFFVLKNITFYTLIAPTALISSSASFGVANIFCHNVFIGPGTHIGNANLFNVGVTIGHDAKIGNFNMINGHVDITGFASIGDNNILGSHAVLIPKSKVQSFCKIGAGSVVYRKIKNNTLAVGNPAQKIALLTNTGEIDGNLS